MISNFRFSDKALSANGGLALFQQLLENSSLRSSVQPAMPSNKIKTASSAYDKFRNLLMGLLMGAECLDDMEKCHEDPVFDLIAGDELSAVTYGNFLRSFAKPQIRELQKALVSHSLGMHKALNKGGDIILDIDSTSHLQYGRKKEGLKINYSGENCLDSLNVFDQFGLSYHIDVREGSTFTATNAPYVIEEIGRVLRKELIGNNRFLRADSGYCNNQVFDACDKFGFKFVIALRENFYGGMFKKRLQWRKPKSDTLANEGLEIAENHYHSRLNGKLYRAVLIRKPILGPRPLFEDAKWEYHAFITNMSSQHEMTHDDVILFYRGRGNAENYIRELKYGFDLKHFPCKKLDANRVYGLIAAFAHNLVRFVSCRMFPGKTAFVKKIRFRLINLAAQVVRQARQVHIVFNTRYKEEIERCIMNIKFSPSSG